MVLRDARSRLIAALSLQPDVAGLEANVLLGHALKKSRAYLLAHPELDLDDASLAPFTALLNRRLTGEPIAYVLGQREFYGLEFSVTPDVLIPRPETELLVELALAHIPSDQPSQILDLGSGSGAIALTLAKLRPQALVTAVDVSPQALTITRQNATRLKVSNVCFIESDWFEALDPSRHFDLIVSNPPYVAQDDPHLRQGDVRFEPIRALQSGADGLQDIRRIAQESLRFLPVNGHLLFEHGYNQKDACAALLSALGYSAIKCQRDLAGQYRVTSGKKS
jgi:release factor glutamine methyltransferase